MTCMTSMSASRLVCSYVSLAAVDQATPECIPRAALPCELLLAAFVELQRT